MGKLLNYFLSGMAALVMAGPASATSKNLDSGVKDAYEEMQEDLGTLDDPFMEWQEDVWRESDDVFTPLMDAMFGGFMGTARPQFMFYGVKGQHQKEMPELKMVETEHYIIYTDMQQTEWLAGLAEEVFEDFSEKTGSAHFVTKPHIQVFSDRIKFSQSREFSDEPSEGLGGITSTKEPNDVVTLFEGSREDLEHVLKHEMRHQFEFSQINRMAYDGKFVTFDGLPMILIEGTAEHDSSGTTAQHRAVVKDTFNNYSHSYFEFQNLDAFYGSYLLYAWGAVCSDALEEFYPGSLVRMREHLDEDNFEDVFRRATGETIEQFNERWMDYLEQNYSTKGLNQYGERSFGEGQLMASDGRNMFIVGDYASGNNELFLKKIIFNGETKKVISKKIVHDGHNAVDSLYYFQAGADLSDDGRLMFAARQGYETKLFIQDFEEKEKKIKLGKRQVFDIENVDVIRSPVFMDGTKVAFIGGKGEDYAIYVFDYGSGSLTKVVDDGHYYDSLDYDKNFGRLVVSREGERIDKMHPDYNYDLHLIDPETGEMSRLTRTSFDDRQPRFSSDGSFVLYQGDRDKDYNLFTVDVVSGEVIQITNEPGMVKNAFFAGDKIIYNSLDKLSLEIRATNGGLDMFADVSPDARFISHFERDGRSVETVSAISDLSLFLTEDGSLFQDGKLLNPDNLEEVVPYQRNMIKQVVSPNGRYTVSVIDGRFGVENDGLFHFEIEKDGKMLDVDEDQFKFVNRQFKFTDLQFLNNKELLMVGSKMMVYNLETGEMKKFASTVGKAPWNLKPIDSYYVEALDQTVIVTGQGLRDIYLYDDENVEKLFGDRPFDGFEVQGDDLFFYEVMTGSGSGFLDTVGNGLVLPGFSVITYDLEDKAFSEEYLPAASGQMVNRLVKNDRFFAYEVQKHANSKSSLIQIDQDGERYSYIYDRMLDKSFKIYGGLDDVILQDERAIVISGERFFVMEDGIVTISRPKGEFEILTVVNGEPELAGKTPVVEFKEHEKSNRKLFAPGKTKVYGAASNYGGLVYAQTEDRVSSQKLFLFTQFSPSYITSCGIYFDFSPPNGSNPYFLQWYINAYDGFADIQTAIGLPHTFDRYTRLEFLNGYDYRYLSSDYGELAINEFLWSPAIRLGMDNSYSLNYSGPHNGQSLFMQAKPGISINHGYLNNLDLNIEFREHLTLANWFTLATRVMAGMSVGENPTKFLIGHESMRGYPWDSFSGEQYAVLQADLRVHAFQYGGLIFREPLTGLSAYTFGMDLSFLVYADIGMISNDFQMEHIPYSVGIGGNIPLPFVGLNLKIAKGLVGGDLYGESEYDGKDWFLWIGRQF